jgi:hypothetical protein
MNAKDVFYLTSIKRTFNILDPEFDSLLTYLQINTFKEKVQSGIYVSGQRPQFRPTKFWKLRRAASSHILRLAGEATPSVDMAAKLSDVLGVSLDYLVGKTDIELDKAILDKIISIQKLPEEDRKCIMYSIDGLIQHAKNRKAYAS